jgi:hypothetical protein
MVCTTLHLCIGRDERDALCPDIPGNDPHAGTFREKNGGAFGVAGVAWLKWRLNADPQAARMFEGADCTLCKDPKWDVLKKNMK